MPIDFKSALAFGPSLVLSGMLEQGTKQTLAHILRDMHDIKVVRHTVDLPVRKVPENRPRYPYLQQRLWRLSLLSRLWHLLLLSCSGQSFQFFNSSSISSPLLVHGRFRGSVSPSNRSLHFLHGSSSRIHLRCLMNTFFEDPGSLSSRRYVMSSMHLTHPKNPWTTYPARYS